jgi:hypothetical protein
LEAGWKRGLCCSGQPKIPYRWIGEPWLTFQDNFGHADFYFQERNRNKSIPVINNNQFPHFPCIPNKRFWTALQRISRRKDSTGSYASPSPDDASAFLGG